MVHYTTLVAWFHHILDDTKRRNLRAWAEAAGLRGMSRHGTPGCLVVEGPRPAVEWYVRKLRGCKWKTMDIRGEQHLLAATQVNK